MIPLLAGLLALVTLITLTEAFRDRSASTVDQQSQRVGNEMRATVEFFVASIARGEATFNDRDQRTAKLLEPWSGYTIDQRMGLLLVNRQISSGGTQRCVMSRYVQQSGITTISSEQGLCPPLVE